ncbi:MAG TPA: hypothetical protein VHO29_19790 [Marmoricola sp.]|nr:hypothetical protein [Marmoricola sp.]
MNDLSSGRPNAAAGSPAQSHRTTPWATLWNAATGAVATAAGIAPHVLHHIGLFAGAFFITGAAGNALFGVLGLVLSIPLLRRLYRRFGTWRAPAIAVGVFLAMFSLSAFVIGPAITGGSSPSRPAPAPVVTPDGHAGHHS